MSGWNVDQQHREQRRDSEKFASFIRQTVAWLPASSDYFVDERPLLPDLPQKGRFLTPRSNALFTASQYTLANPESSMGPRWKAFPVSWNKGSSQPGVPNGGADAIASAFLTWNNDAGSNVNYVFATSVVNAFGADDFHPDQVNNVVFEKDMSTTRGIANFSCTNGGTIGYCITTAKIVDATNVAGGEQFYAITETDISMNKGVGACIGSNITVANFNTALTHEFGHSLGFRHADTTRNLSAACSTNGTYDCASSALMTAYLAGGPSLQAWDQRAAAALYPSSAPAAPASLVATATTATAVALTWNASANATSYDVYRQAPGGGSAFLASSGTNSYTDNSAAPATAYLYTVRAKNGGGTSADSNRDLATTVIFTDDPLLAATTDIKATHLSELRAAVNAVRAQANLAAFGFTDPAPSGLTVRAAHLSELRDALDAAALTPTGGYTDPSMSGTAIKAIHLQELRNRMK